MVSNSSYSTLQYKTIKPKLLVWYEWKHNALRMWLVKLREAADIPHFGEVGRGLFQTESLTTGL